MLRFVATSIWLYGSSSNYLQSGNFIQFSVSVKFLLLKVDKIIKPVFHFLLAYFLATVAYGQLGVVTNT